MLSFETLQPIVRKTSEAFLARRILVCEGRTEIGFCRRLDRYWAETGPSFGLAGIALADGGGGGAPKVASAFAQLRYGVVLLADSDQPLQPDQLALESVGVVVLQWNNGFSLEQRVAADCPWPSVAAVVELAMKERGDPNVRDTIRSELGDQQTSLKGSPNDWPQQIPEEALRTAIGLAAKKARGGDGWFKRVDLAEELAGVVITCLDALGDTDLGRKILALRQWAHGDR